MTNSVTNRILRFFSFVFFVFLFENTKAQSTDVFKSAYIKTTLLKVADWQLKNHNARTARDWTNGAFYTGVYAAYETTKSNELLDSLITIFERNNWMPGLRYDHADDIAISQSYIDLYRIKKDRKIILGLVSFIGFPEVKRIIEIIIDIKKNIEAIKCLFTICFP